MSSLLLMVTCTESFFTVPGGSIGAAAVVEGACCAIPILQSGRPENPDFTKTVKRLKPVSQSHQHFVGGDVFQRASGSKFILG